MFATILLLSMIVSVTQECQIRWEHMILGIRRGSSTVTGYRSDHVYRKANSLKKVSKLSQQDIYLHIVAATAAIGLFILTRQHLEQKRYQPAFNLKINIRIYVE